MPFQVLDFFDTYFTRAAFHMILDVIYMIIRSFTYGLYFHFLIFSRPTCFSRLYFKISTLHRCQMPPLIDFDIIFISRVISLYFDIITCTYFKRWYFIWYASKCRYYYTVISIHIEGSMRAFRAQIDIREYLLDFSWYLQKAYHIGNKTVTLVNSTQWRQMLLDIFSFSIHCCYFISGRWYIIMI